MKNIFKNLFKLKTIGKWGEIDDFLTFALYYQLFFGHQVLDPNWSWRKSSIQCLIFISVLLYCFLGSLKIIVTEKDISLVAGACSLLIMISIFPINLFLFIQNRNVFRKLYLQVKTHLLDDITAGSDKTAVLRTAKIYTIILMTVSGSSYIYHQLRVIWNYVQGNYVLLTTTAILVPMRSPYFEVAWVLQSLCFALVAATTFLDMWFVLLTHFLCAASDSLVNILKVDKIRDFESKEIYGQRLNQTLRQFYNSHVNHIKFLSSLNKMYKWLSLVPVFSAAMCLCLILSVLSVDLELEIFSIGLIMLDEIFIYNYFGEKVKTKVADIKTALLHFDWTSLSVQDRKNYYIIITFIQKDFGIKTAAGNDLSLISMTSVLDVSYRAFTVLRSV